MVEGTGRFPFTKSPVRAGRVVAGAKTADLRAISALVRVFWRPVAAMLDNPAAAGLEYSANHFDAETVCDG